MKGRARSIAFVDDNPEARPANHGRPNRHTRFAQPEQVEELAERMCRNNYSEAGIRSILGGNFHRGCQHVWNQVLTQGEKK